MARELALKFGNESPFWKLLSIRPFDEQPANLIATKLKPEHIIGQVEVEIVLLGVGFEQLALGHQVLLLRGHLLRLGTCSIPRDHTIFAGLGRRHIQILVHQVCTAGATLGRVAALVHLRVLGLIGARVSGGTAVVLIVLCFLVRPVLANIL